MSKKRKSLSGRLTIQILVLLFIIMSMLSFMIFETAKDLTSDLYATSYHHITISTHEYVQRMLSTVNVATQNNVYVLEQHIDKPDSMMADMERIVRNNIRIRSCGISFVDGFYPQKGRWYCPYAWRVTTDREQVQVMNLGDVEHDYLDDEWFTNIIKSDSAQWSEPFFDGFDAKTPLIAHLVPIHDKKGRPVAVLGADVSLDWLTNKLHEVDSLTNEDVLIGSNESEQLQSYSFIIRRDGTFITHSEEGRILKDNFFNHIKEFKGSNIEVMKKKINAGITSDEEEKFNFDVDGRNCYVFYCPVKESDWVVVMIVPWLCIDSIGIVLGIILLFFIIVAMIFIAVVCYFTTRSATKSLKELATTADEVARGHFDTPLPAIKYNDEVRLLRDSFEGMQSSLTKYIDELKATTASKAAIDNELKIAHNIQMAMLPKDFPPYPERKDFEVYGSLTPAKAVGGDLFDFFIHDEQFFFYIGDVSGKGVPAALVMAVTRSLLRNISAHISEPNHIVTTLNETLSEGNNTNMFVTLFVGVLDLKSGQLCYCNAGHDAPLLINKDVTPLTVESNLPVGVMKDWEYVAQEVQLEHGTTIFLYTDGLNEAENVTREQFGIQRLFHIAQLAIAENNNQTESIVNRMTAAVHDFVGEAEQSDDLTMLAIKFT